MASLLRKFKVTHCPFDGEVLRTRAFEVHLKQAHPHANAFRVLKENTCLICTAHTQPKIERMVHTRRGNDAFIDKHKTHLANRLAPLSEIEKEAVRQAVNDRSTTFNVDLDATPPSIPNAHQAIGTIGMLDTPSMINDNDATPSVVDIETMMFLDDQNPLELEPESAAQLNESYRSIFEPGLQYPLPSTHQQVTITSENEAEGPTPDTARHDAAQQTSDTTRHDAAQQTLDTARQDAAQQTSDTDRHDAAEQTNEMEEIPLLTHSLDHIREMNSMKNVMLTQIMQDNVDLLESKLQSRKQALQAMEELFETHAQNMSDDMTLELSRIIHLKNKLIQQLLRETASLHPHVYNVMTRN